jgi:predicted nucleotidyltransferase
MLTRKNLNYLLKDVPVLLNALGIEVERLILFGSYAKGNVYAYSDVEIAIWSPQFSGYGLADLELYRPLLRKYPLLDLKTYTAGQNANDDPFIEVIENTGTEIPLHEEETRIK